MGLPIKNGKIIITNNQPQYVSFDESGFCSIIFGERGGQPEVLLYDQSLTELGTSKSR